MSTEIDGLSRAACYGQDDDAKWLAAWADEHRPYMISGSGNALHLRSCGLGNPNVPSPRPVPEYSPRPVYLTVMEAMAFLDESSRHHHCGICGPGGHLDRLAERRPHRRIPCGTGWPRTVRPKTMMTHIRQAVR